MKKIVYFATPVFDHAFVSEYQASMMMTCIHLQHHGIEVRGKFIGGLCFIDLARNELVDHFLKSDATDLFFIDADVGWDFKAVKRLLDYDEEIVGGLVPKRTNPVQFHMNALNGICVGNLLETLELPTAFMRIKRSAFEKLDKAYPQYSKYNTLGKGKAYFQTGYVPCTGEYDFTFEGEDIFFCRQWVKMGGKIWVDPQINFQHRGSQDWRGNFCDYALEKGILTASEDSCQVEPVSRTGT